MNRMIRAAFVAAIAIACARSAEAQPVEVTTPVYPRPFCYAMGGNASGSWAEVQLDAATKRLLVALPTPGNFYGGGADGDTTGPATSWRDTDGASWSTANLYVHKSVFIKVNSVASASTGSIVFRIQGSNTGISTDWSDIILPQITAGSVMAAPETLQFVAAPAGNPFLTGVRIPLESVSTASLVPFLNPCAAYAMLRMTVFNRTNSGAAGINHTIRWEGSQ